MDLKITGCSQSATARQILYQHPKYLVFYKGLVLFPNDWSVLDEYVPIAEGNDYAIYSLPSRRR